ncbi:MAG: glycosyltransferase family 9 protein [Deltaproteobacteria bacterium]|nr:glycosyltransferase family 9 protein [Deltaproteobacteria bacterium]
MNPNHILYIRTDRMGDFLMNLPAIHALRQSFPTAKITVLLHPQVQALLQGHPDIDTLIPFDPILKPKNFWIWFSFFWKLRKQHFDAVVISNPHKYFHLFSALLQIPIRVGWDQKWGFLLTHKATHPEQKKEHHEITNNLTLVALLEASLKEDSDSYVIPITLTEEKIFLQKHDITRPILIHPFTTHPAKQWPIENFKSILQKLTSFTSSPCILIGGPEEHPRIVKQFQEELALHNIFDLSGCLTLKELAILLKHSRFLFSNDSGPVHIAAAFQTPMLILYGRQEGSSPKRWLPWHPACTASPISYIAKDDIRAISVEEVWQKIQEKLNALS